MALISYILQYYWEHRRDDLPEWIWDYPERIQRILHGHDLFPEAAGEREESAAYGRTPNRRTSQLKKYKTLRQRLALCGTSSVLLDDQGNFRGRIRKPATVVMAELEAANAASWQQLVALPVDIEETQLCLLTITV